MTVETPEQRRERLAQVVRQNIDLGRLGNALQVARDVADAIIASDEAAGLVVVPVEPTERMIKAGRMKMPVQIKYWQEGGTIHAKLIPQHEAVSE